jgi:hypothetical protein
MFVRVNVAEKLSGKVKSTVLTVLSSPFLPGLACLEALGRTVPSQCPASASSGCSIEIHFALQCLSSSSSPAAQDEESLVATLRGVDGVPT